MDVLRWDPDELAVNEDAFAALAAEVAEVKGMQAMADPTILPFRAG